MSATARDQALLARSSPCDGRCRRPDASCPARTSAFSRRPRPRPVVRFGAMSCGLGAVLDPHPRPDRLAAHDGDHDRAAASLNCGLVRSGVGRGPRGPRMFITPPPPTTRAGGFDGDLVEALSRPFDDLPRESGDVGDDVGERRLSSGMGTSSPGGPGPVELVGADGDLLAGRPRRLRVGDEPFAGQLGGVRRVLGGDVGVGGERVGRLGVGPEDGLLGAGTGDDRSSCR